MPLHFDPHLLPIFGQFDPPVSVGAQECKTLLRLQRLGIQQATRVIQSQRLTAHLLMRQLPIFTGLNWEFTNRTDEYE